MKIKRSLPLPCLLFLLFGPVQAEEPSPAPAEDNVGFPKDYAKSFSVLRTVIRDDGAKLVTIYGNKPAASVTNTVQLPYPYGSVIVMETASTQKDDDGQPLKDANGELKKAEVQGMHVMRKEKGFGQAYAGNRSGEWEYVEYRADGSYLTTAAKSASCAACHVKAGKEKDFVYHARLAD